MIPRAVKKARSWLAKTPSIARIKLKMILCILFFLTLMALIFY